VKSLLGGIFMYYVCLGVAWFANADPNQLAWFFFICVFLVPRALLASFIGLVCWETYSFVKKAAQGADRG
jgi:hypothetical protein